MRLLVLIGLLLALAGGLVLVRGLPYSSERSVLRVGDFEATLEERHAVPPWLGAVALAGGAALLVEGLRRWKP